MKVILDINYGNENAVEMIIAMTNECDNNNCYEIRNVITEKNDTSNVIDTTILAFEKSQIL